MDPIIEAAFIDELEKIAAGGGFLKTLGEWGGKKLMGTPLKTHAMRAAVGAVPGMVAGAAAGGPDHRIRGALTGGLVGGVAGAAGGKLLEHGAIQKTTNTPFFSRQMRGPHRPEMTEKIEGLRGQVLPGIV
jgi:hypothetical protein